MAAAFYYQIRVYAADLRHNTCYRARETKLMNPYLIAFLTLPIAAIVAKLFFKWRLSLWIIFFGCVLSGWGLAHLAVERHFDNLDALVRSTPNQVRRCLMLCSVTEQRRCSHCTS